MAKKNTDSDNKVGASNVSGTGTPKTTALPPSWFSKECIPQEFLHTGNEIALSHYLNTCRQDAYSALSLYQTHVRYVTTLLTAVLSGEIGLLSLLYSKELQITFTTPWWMGIPLIFIIILICICSLVVVTKYHNFWGAALLFAAEAHYTIGTKGFHWFELTEEEVGKAYAKDNRITREKFISSRTWYSHHSHVYYFWLIVFLSIACVFTSFAIYCKIVPQALTVIHSFL